MAWLPMEPIVFWIVAGYIPFHLPLVTPMCPLTRRSIKTLSTQFINCSRLVALSETDGAQPYAAGCAPPAMFAISGVRVAVGGGGEGRAVATGGSTTGGFGFAAGGAPPFVGGGVVTTVAMSMTFPLCTAATGLPLIFRVPPSGAVGGAKAPVAFEAPKMNSLRVLVPSLGLIH